jgi:nucleotide-binding universal stress UspA family protein
MLKIQGVLAPIDFSQSSIEALRIANDIAERYSARLHIVHVISSDSSIKTPLHPTQYDAISSREDEEKDAKAQLSDIVKKYISKKVDIKQHVLFGNPAHEILELIDGDPSIDLVVIATHGRTGLKRFVFGSVTEKIIRHSNCAVLTIRSFERRLAERLL